MSSFDSHPRTLLFVSVSVIALLAASPEVRGADLPRAPMFAKAPVAVPTDRLAVWVEGSAFSTGGSDVWFGDPTDVGRVKWGREGAVGFDYRFAVTQWHVSAQFRYGSAAANAEAFSRRGTFLVSGSSTTKKFPALGTGSFSSRETHWLADFAAGRDIGLGVGQTQLKFGVRIADLQAKTTGEGSADVPLTLRFHGPVAVRTFSLDPNSRFTGAGPRAGLEGMVPLGGAWSFDWLGGAALLFGSRSLDVGVAGSAANFGIVGVDVSDNATLFNVDAQAGLSYWFAPNAKLTGSYRFDGYWGELKTINSAGAVANADRLFYGPTLRFTLQL